MKSLLSSRWLQHMSIFLNVCPNSPGYPRDKSKNILCTDPLSEILQRLRLSTQPTRLPHSALSITTCDKFPKRGIAETLTL